MILYDLLQYFDNICEDKPIKKLLVFSKYLKSEVGLINSSILKKLIEKSEELRACLSELVDLIKLGNTEFLLDEMTETLLGFYCKLYNIVGVSLDVGENLKNNKKLPKYLLKEEEFSLIKKAQAGDQEAYLEFYERNWVLVVEIAKSFNLPDMEDDLIQEGSVVLGELIFKYDLSRGVRFITYAYRIIHQKMIEYLQLAQVPYSIKGNVLNRVLDYQHFCESYEEHHGKLPSLKEAALELGKSYKAVERYAKLAQEPLNIDDVMILDETNYQDYNDFDFHSFYTELLEKSGLTDRQKEALLKYHAKTNNSWVNVGKEMNITRAGANSYGHKALIKIRNYIKKRFFKGFAPLCELLPQYNMGLILIGISFLYDNEVLLLEKYCVVQNIPFENGWFSLDDYQNLMEGVLPKLCVIIDNERERSLK